jgi:hypothetical protein
VVPVESTESKVEYRGGVVFRVSGELRFLPASIAMKVMPIPEMARVPGGPLELRGVALVEGNMIPVVDVLEDPSSQPGGAMLVCVALGESVGLVGIDVVATGRFEAAEQPGSVKVGVEIARAFDVGDVIARVREGRWAV